MKKLGTLLIILCFAVTSLTSGQAMAVSTDFTDTGDHWAKSYIDRLATSEYISGYPDNSFRPQKTMSRAEFIIILINVLGATPTDTTTYSFSDTGDHWARGYINEAVKRGLFFPGEYPNGLKPDQPIKRSEATAALMRALDKLPQEGVLNFKDAATIEQSMYKGFIRAAVNEGVMNGYEDGTFRPFDNIVRAEAAVLFCRFLDKKGGSSLTPGQPGITINPATDNLETVEIDDVSYQVGAAAISFKTESGIVKATIISKYSDGLLLNYSTRVSLSPGDTEILVNNVRYGVSGIEITGKQLVVTPSYCKLASISLNNYNYNSEYIDLYINEKSSGYLSDLEIVDKDTVEKDGETYDLDDDEIVIDIEDDFYTIEGLNIDSDGIELDLEETTPLVLKHLSISDIESIEDDSNELDIDDIDEISFIIENRKYSLNEVSFNKSGYIEIDDKEYSPSKVVMVIDDEFYDLEELEINRRGKLEIYCDYSDREFIRIDGWYMDKDDVVIIYDDEEYEVDDVLVVKRYIVRIGGGQYDVRDRDFECKYGGDTYDIEEIDWDTNMDMMVIETEEGIDNAGDNDDNDEIDPDEYHFYVDGSKYQEGTDDVEIKVSSTWRDFDSIEVLSETRYSYGSSSYDMIGAKIRIDGDGYEIDDTAWSSSTDIFRLYLIETDDEEIDPDEYYFYIDGSKYQEGLDDVEIKVGSTWRDFDSIEVLSETRYRYGSSSYDLIGAKIRIDGDDYEVEDTAWSSSSNIFRVYLVED